MRVTRGHEARHQAFAKAVRREHQAIVAAIAAGDAAAARRAAVRHMQHAEARLQRAGLVPAARPPAHPATRQPARRTQRAA
jgi:GntR family transcriptional repressor for pyruvate dehydrogenase complex